MRNNVGDLVGLENRTQQVAEKAQPLQKSRTAASATSAPPMLEGTYQVPEEGRAADDREQRWWSTARAEADQMGI